MLLAFGRENWGVACCFIYQIFDISYGFPGFVPSTQLELVRCGNSFIHTNSAVTHGLSFCQMSLRVAASTRSKLSNERVKATIWKLEVFRLLA